MLLLCDTAVCLPPFPFIFILRTACIFSPLWFDSIQHVQRLYSYSIILSTSEAKYIYNVSSSIKKLFPPWLKGDSFSNFIPLFSSVEVKMRGKKRSTKSTSNGLTWVKGILWWRVCKPLTGSRISEWAARSWLELFFSFFPKFKVVSKTRCYMMRGSKEVPAFTVKKWF